jgi:regulator of sigma E protease
MNGLVMAAQLILGLSILVVLHEFGHYIAARAFGIRVEKFYLFFDAWGIKLFSFKKGDTEYGVGWLPLGGYVKISGMIDESMDKEAMKLPPQPWEFRSKPAWQRLIVMIGGVTMNVILGIAIYALVLLNYTEKYLPVENISDGIYAYELGRDLGFQTGDKIVSFNNEKVERFEELLGTRVLFGGTFQVDRNGKILDIEVPDDFYKTVAKKGRGRFIGADNRSFDIEEVSKNSPAERAKLQKGDKIVAVNDTSITTFGQFREIIFGNGGKEISLKILRDKNELELTTKLDSDAVLGISSNPFYELKNYTPSSALSFGTSDALEAIVSNAKGLKKIFTGEEKASESLQGPIGIANIYGSVWDWQRFCVITGLLSMVLALMNILPIPALDGGHVIFLIIESVTGKKFSDKFMERAQIAGMVILLSIMAFAIGNDVWKHFIR